MGKWLCFRVHFSAPQRPQSGYTRA